MAAITVAILANGAEIDLVAIARVVPWITICVGPVCILLLGSLALNKPCRVVSGHQAQGLGQFHENYGVACSSSCQRSKFARFLPDHVSLAYMNRRRANGSGDGTK